MELTTKPACKYTMGQVQALRIALNAIADVHLEAKIARGRDNICRQIPVCDCDYGKAYRTIEAMGVDRISAEDMYPNTEGFPF